MSNRPLWVPDQLMRALAKRAKERGESLRTLVTRALRRELKE